MIATGAHREHGRRWCPRARGRRRATPAAAHPTRPASAEIVVRDSSDAALVRDCLAGAPGAWDAFVARFAGLFSHVVDRTCSQRRLEVSAADRDDVVAEILVELLKGDAAVLRAFAGRASLPTYLTVIARRTAVRMMKRHDPAPNAPAPAATAAAPDQERRRADREEIERLLGKLDAADARLIRLHHLEGRSYGEISRITGLPLGSIGPALSRARRKMRGTPEESAGPADGGARSPA